MSTIFETPLYEIRLLQPADAEGIFLLDSDPEVHKFLGNNPIKSMAEAEKVVAYIMGQYEQFGVGRWAIIEKASQEFVGWTGLKYEDVLRPGQPYYDLGYRLRPKFWGRGIATLTARMSVDYGFETLGYEAIGGAADIRHEVSNHVLQKAGLQFVDTFEYDSEPHHWYNLKREEWLAQ
ncbi:GNAT family N-acetyltransferase [Persicobacter diffluens]|uniref:N-acetyltransferase n=1 Tax=Persicobacter diffluens TaxID=981 RepID=A0AAN5AKA9_9BACT|nr:N-acetyltransferase [Persicobacter diffluens]